MPKPSWQPCVTSSRAGSERGFHADRGWGTGRIFELGHNQRWHEETRPILEAFFHARMMLQMAVQYAGKLDSRPAMLPNGWAAFLYLYRLR